MNSYVVDIHNKCFIENLITVQVLLSIDSANGLVMCYWLPKVVLPLWFVLSYTLSCMTYRCCLFVVVFFLLMIMYVKDIPRVTFR